jgi:hypothetical protein
MCRIWQTQLVNRGNLNLGCWVNFNVTDSTSGEGQLAGCEKWQADNIFKNHPRLIYHAANGSP